MFTTWLASLPTPMKQSSVNINPFVGSEMEVGLYSQRRRTNANMKQVAISIMFNNDQFDTFKDFYYVTLDSGAKGVSMPLRLFKDVINYEGYLYWSGDTRDGVNTSTIDATFLVLNVL